MNKAFITEMIENYLNGSDNYLVDVRLEAGDRIVVEIDNDVAVSIDDCMALSRYVESQLNRDAEDYELEVGSAGLSQPFKLVRQYRKAVGKAVEVRLKNGQKHAGVLKAADEQAIVLTVKKPLEGAKRKTMAEEDLSFRYDDDIKYTKYIIKL
jgi:ribosome maturation factor RimP